MTGVLFFGAENAGSPILPATRPRAAISWSGGKDSCAALHRTHAQYDVVCMITMFGEDTARSRSHGLRPEVLEAQAGRLDLDASPDAAPGRPMMPRSASAAGSQGRQRVSRHLRRHPVDEHRAWAERQCAAHGLTAVEPLFGLSTLALFHDWIASGAEAIIVTARAEFFDESWLGVRCGRRWSDEFARLGVDPCGERGEYHTAVTNSPLFSAPIEVVHGERVFRSGCHAMDISISQQAAVDGQQLGGRRRRGRQSDAAR